LIPDAGVLEPRTAVSTGTAGRDVPDAVATTAPIDGDGVAFRTGSAVPGGILRSTPAVIVNAHGDIAFVGDVTLPSSRSRQAGVYVSSGGHLRAILRPGDALPGGGTLLTASLAPGNLDLDSAGDVAFTLTMRDEHDGAFDTGIALWHGGRLEMIARS